MPHLSIDVATMVLAGELPPRVLVRLLVEHLKDLCPDCREALEAVQNAPPRPAATATAAAGPEQYLSAIDGAGRRIGEQLRTAEAERQRAVRDLATLRSLPAAERGPRIAAARTRFRSRALAELLVSTSRDLARHDPAEAAALADLVPLVLGRRRGVEGPGEVGLRVLAIAYRGNARRVAGDLAGADAAFVAARERLAASALDDAGLHAEVCRVEAPLRREQRRLEHAEHLLDRAVLLSRLAKDERGIATALIQLADLLIERDDFAAAIDALRQALARIDPAADRHLFTCAVGTLALVECERGAFATAERLVGEHRDLLAGGGEAWSMIRLLHLEARIAQGLGRAADAETSLLAAHRICVEAGREFDTAMVSLDLALLYTEEGRFAEVREIAATIQPLFALREYPEATAALLLFQQAAAAERITVEAVRSLRDVLQRHGLAPRPSAAGEQPS